jgi:rSAM/selenodomain-associated transferase 1
MIFTFPRSRIAVFAREPILGKVKTRLLGALGERQALTLYQQMVARITSCIDSSQLAQLDLWVTSNPSHEYFLTLCNEMNIYIQTGSDLGAKMAFAIDHTLAGDAVESVLIVGTDCPVMDAGYLRSALTALRAGNEVVIGPAEDGGYVLIGMRRALPELFADIPWGTDKVLTKTLARLTDLGINYQLLPTLWDVDVPADLVRLEDLQPPLV